MKLWKHKKRELTEAEIAMRSGTREAERALKQLRAAEEALAKMGQVYGRLVDTNESIEAWADRILIGF